MYKIFAGNLAFSTTQEQLRDVFSPHLEVEDVVIAQDPKTDQSRGYGFVMTRDADKGRAAMRKVGKVEIDGRLVYFRESGAKPSRKRKRSRKGGGGFNRRRERRPLPER